MLPDLEHVEPAPGRSFTWDSFDLLSFPYRWHFHAAYELTLITAGHGRRFVGDSIEWFEPGDLVLLGPHLPHTWHSDPGRGCRSGAVVVRFEADCFGADFFERGELARIRGLLERSRRVLCYGGSAAVRGVAAAPGRQHLEHVEQRDHLREGLGGAAAFECRGDPPDRRGAAVAEPAA